MQTLKVEETARKRLERLRLREGAGGPSFYSKGSGNPAAGVSAGAAGSASVLGSSLWLLGGGWVVGGQVGPGVPGERPGWSPTAVWEWGREMQTLWLFQSEAGRACYWDGMLLDFIP